MKTKSKKLLEDLNIIWTIAAKDIIDGLKNKMILSLVLGVLFMVLMPSVMIWMIEPPYATVLVYDPGHSQIVEQLEEDKAFRVQRMPDFDSFEAAVSSLGFGMGTEYGLVVPADFDARSASGALAEVEIYVPWAYRHKISQLSQEIEELLSGFSGAAVQANYADNLVYPPPQSSWMLGLSTQLPVLIVLLVGLNMMPHLFFEEKQIKTMDALLVSPATEGQIVAGKALVGMFYILVTALIAFGMNWNMVVHWEMIALFVVCGGLFGVGVGLILGTFFNRFQEIFGFSMLILLLLIAAIFINILNVDLPEVVLKLLPWVPSATMADMIVAAYLKDVNWGATLVDIASLLTISAVLYTLVIWRLRRSDR